VLRRPTYEGKECTQEFEVEKRFAEYCLTEATVREQGYVVSFKDQKSGTANASLYINV